MGVSQYYDAMVKMEEYKNIDSASTSPYKPPRGHDVEMSDGERAHCGAPGARVKHGHNALNQPGKANSEAAYYHRVRNKLEF